MSNDNDSWKCDKCGHINKKFDIKCYNCGNVRDLKKEQFTENNTQSSNSKLLIILGVFLGFVVIIISIIRFLIFPLLSPSTINNSSSVYVCDNPISIINMQL